MEDRIQFEDDLNFWEHGRRPQFLEKWKTTSIFWENGIQPQLVNGRLSNLFSKMEDDINFLAKWKTISTF